MYTPKGYPEFESRSLRKSKFHSRLRKQLAVLVVWGLESLLSRPQTAKMARGPKDRRLWNGDLVTIKEPREIAAAEGRRNLLPLYTFSPWRSPKSAPQLLPPCYRPSASPVAGLCGLAPCWGRGRVGTSGGLRSLRSLRPSHCFLNICLGASSGQISKNQRAPPTILVRGCTSPRKCLPFPSLHPALHNTANSSFRQEPPLLSSTAQLPS